MIRKSMKYSFIKLRLKVENSNNKGLCYVKLIMSLILGGLILSSFSLNLTNTIRQMNNIVHGVELLQMNRFARQKIYRKLKYSKGDILVNECGAYGEDRLKWGVRVTRDKVGIVLSDGQLQPLTGQVFRNERFGYRIKLKKMSGITSDDNKLISYKWSMVKHRGLFEHKVNSAVYPYYYYLKKYEK